MIDVHTFGRDFREKLISLAAESRGVGRIEAVRKYQTDAHFRLMIDTIVQAAVETILVGEDVRLNFDPLRETFHQEAGALLGWTS